MSDAQSGAVWAWSRMSLRSSGLRACKKKVSPAMYWRFVITSVSGRRRLCKSCNCKGSLVCGDKLSCCGMA